MILPSLLACAQEKPLDVGSRKQLFIDRRFIATSAGVTLRTNPAQKLGQLLDADGKLHGQAVVIPRTRDI